jgi:prepilin-type N-terminal cleavage/methylation domain-containing protein/prepilin-type processing-associated H-X9-DG protein
MRSRRGFTLVELLVVVGIVALLVGILLPALSSARATSRQVRCLSSLRSLSLADQMYQAAYKGLHVPGYWGWSAASGGWPPNPPPPIPASGPRRYWFHAEPFAGALPAVKPGTGRFAQGAVCPDAPLTEQRVTKDGYTIHNSYAMNYSQLPGMAVRLAPDYVNAWRFNEVLAPADKIQFVDAVSEGVSVSKTNANNSTLRYFNPYYGERHEPPDKGSTVAYRHRKGANALFYDGHAAWLAAGDLRYDPADPATAGKLRQWLPKEK